MSSPSSVRCKPGLRTTEPPSRTSRGRWSWRNDWADHWMSSVPSVVCPSYAPTCWTSGVPSSRESERSKPRARAARRRPLRRRSMPSRWRRSWSGTSTVWRPWPTSSRRSIVGAARCGTCSTPIYQSYWGPLAHGEWDTALQRLNEAEKIAEGLQDRGVLPLYLASRSWLERSRGAYGEALSLGRRAVASAEELGHLEWQAWGNYVLGRTLLEVGGGVDAIPVLERALEIATEGGSIAMQVRAGGFLTVALLGAGDDDASIEGRGSRSRPPRADHRPRRRHLLAWSRRRAGVRERDRRVWVRRIGPGSSWMRSSNRPSVVDGSRSPPGPISSGLACCCRMVPLTKRRSPRNEC